MFYHSLQKFVMLKHIKIFLIFFSLISITRAQTFGFGCLGFVGGYGGFVYQDFNASGLNEYINNFNQAEFVNTPVDEFSKETGFRVGLNLFRATFQKGFIITAKGFYQSLATTNKGSVGAAGTDDNFSMKLNLQNWAIGFDVGWEFTRLVSWKILDGSLNFNYVTLTETTDLPGETTVQKYKSDSGVIGYSIGTGIIISLLKDYISLEGSAGYTYLSIANVYNENGTPLLNPVSVNNSEYIKNDFINRGGFTAVVQLNVGFPLL